MHRLGLRLFGAATVWKLLNIEPFSWWKLNQIKTEETMYWNWEVFSVNCWKALSESNLIEFISELRCGRCWILSGFFVGNSNKLQKNWVSGGKIGWSRPQCVHIANFRKKFNSENVKNKECVHTWATDTGDTSGYKGRNFGCIIQMTGEMVGG